MKIALTSILLSFVAYLSGVFVARTMTSNVDPLAKWLKKTKSANVGIGIQAIMMPYHRLAFLICSGNVLFGCLLVVSGVLFGFPALFLLFRSTILTWGVLEKQLLGRFGQVGRLFRALILGLACVEALLFILWTSIGVGIGLSLLAMLIGYGDGVFQLMPLLPVLLWMAPGMVLTHVLCALLEARIMIAFKPAIIRSFFDHSSEITEHPQDLVPEKEPAE
jgi:hypothetical protein